MIKLFEDTEKRILDTLAVWLSDSLAECESVGMAKSRSTAIVMRAMMYAFLTGLAKKGSSKSDVLEVVSTNWDIIIEHKKEAN